MKYLTKQYEAEYIQHDDTTQRMQEQYIIYTSDL
jgi:hypothetical protein